jgi:hypothetical protein
VTVIVALSWMLLLSMCTLGGRRKRTASAISAGVYYHYRWGCGAAGPDDRREDGLRYGTTSYAHESTQTETLFWTLTVVHLGFFGSRAEGCGGEYLVSRACRVGSISRCRRSAGKVGEEIGRKARRRLRLQWGGNTPERRRIVIS